MRDLPESKLFAPVRDWLIAQGYKVFAEYRGHDVAAFRETDDRIVVVELKMCLSRGVLRQCMRGSYFADAVYAAVPSKPRTASLDLAKESECGVLLVGDSVAELLPAPKPYYRIDTYRERALRHLRARQPDNQIGGLPTLAGNGPSQRLVEKIAAYRESHPGCGWRDIFRDVPNHYASHASMRQAMKSTGERIARREARNHAQL